MNSLLLSRIVLPFIVLSLQIYFSSARGHLCTKLLNRYEDAVGKSCQRLDFYGEAMSSKKVPVTNFTTVNIVIHKITLRIKDKIDTFIERCNELRDNYCVKDVGTCHCDHKFKLEIQGKMGIKDWDADCQVNNFHTENGCYRFMYSYKSGLGCTSNSNSPCTQLRGFVDCKVLGSKILNYNNTPKGSCSENLPLLDPLNTNPLLSRIISVSTTYDEETGRINYEWNWDIQTLDFWLFVLDFITKYWIYLIVGIVIVKVLNRIYRWFLYCRNVIRYARNGFHFCFLFCRNVIRYARNGFHFRFLFCRNVIRYARNGCTCVGHETND